MAKPSMLDQMKSYIAPSAPAGKLRDRSKKINKELEKADGDSHSGSNYYSDTSDLQRNNAAIRKRRQGGY